MKWILYSIHVPAYHVVHYSNLINANGFCWSVTCICIFDKVMRVHTWHIQTHMCTHYHTDKYMYNRQSFKPDEFTSQVNRFGTAASQFRGTTIISVWSYSTLSPSVTHILSVYYMHYLCPAITPQPNGYYICLTPCAPPNNPSTMCYFAPHMCACGSHVICSLCQSNSDYLAEIYNAW